MNLLILFAVVAGVVGVGAGYVWAKMRATTELAELRAEKKSLTDQLAAFRADEERLKSFFNSLAAEALGRSSEQFLQLANEKLGAQQKDSTLELEMRKQEIEKLVQPLATTLQSLEKHVGEMETKREGAYSELLTNVKNLQGGQEAVRDEARRLSEALKNPSTRGRWGEFELERIVKLAGMVEHCHFEKQEHFRDAEDRAGRPDLTIKLPGDRAIFVDSKVPLSAYWAATQATDEKTRLEKCKEHTKQLKDHIRDLAKKEYWKQVEGVELVVVFLPLESLLATAFETDPELLEFSVENHVVLATPISLIALLKAVSYGWDQKELAEDAQQIIDSGKKLHERLSTMFEHIVKLGKEIKGSVSAFNNMVGSLERSVLPSARRFSELTKAEEIGGAEQIEVVPRELQIPPQPGRLRRLVAAAGDEKES